MTYELRMERLIDAPPEVVFDVWGDPEAQLEMFDGMVPGWRLHGLELDFRVGGSMSFEFGPSEGEGERDRVKSVFTEIDRPHRLVQEETAYIAEWKTTLNTTVTMTFEDAGGGKTLLQIVQTGFTSEKERDGLSEGWPDVLDALQRVCEARAARSDR